MSATTPAAFDPKPKCLGLVVDCIAAGAILAGQVVSIEATGVGFQVTPCDGVTTAHPVGVALYSQATTGGPVAVAGQGSVLKVCEGAGTGIDGGDMVQCDVSTALGCVITTVDTAVCYQIGVALEDITANSAGYVLLTGPLYLGKGA
jgi:hypothetical protein